MISLTQLAFLERALFISSGPFPRSQFPPSCGFRFTLEVSFINFALRFPISSLAPSRFSARAFIRRSSWRLAGFRLNLHPRIPLSVQLFSESLAIRYRLQNTTYTAKVYQGEPCETPTNSQSVSQWLHYHSRDCSGRIAEQACERDERGRCVLTLSVR